MGRVAAITGAATDSGRALARAYADAGWDIALLGRGWAGLEAAAADVRERGRDALVVPIDVTDDAARQLAVHRIQEELGPIEAWVADALIPRFRARPVWTPSPSRRQAILRRAASLLTLAEEAIPASGLTGPAIAAVVGVVVIGVIIGTISRRA